MSTAFWVLEGWDWIDLVAYDIRALHFWLALGGVYVEYIARVSPRHI